MEGDGQQNDEEIMNAPLTAEELDRAVLVRNLSVDANEAALEDFFSFCGSVDFQYLYVGRKEAVVVFQDAAARQAALLVNGGMLLNEPVTIMAVPEGYTAESGAPTSGLATEDDDGDIPVTTTEELLGDTPMRSKTVPARSAGFFSRPLLSEDWFSNMKQTLNDVTTEYTTAAREIGSEYKTVASEVNAGVREKLSEAHIQEQLQAARESAARSASATRAKVAELSAQYEVGNKVSAVTTRGREAVKQVDDSLGISRRAASVAQVSRHVAQEVDDNYQISERTRDLASQALDNQTLRSGLQSFSDGWSALKSQISSVTTGATRNSNGEFSARTDAPNPATNGEPRPYDVSEETPTSPTGSTEAATGSAQDASRKEGGPEALAVD